MAENSFRSEQKTLRQQQDRPEHLGQRPGPGGAATALPLITVIKIAMGSAGQSGPGGRAEAEAS